RSEVTKDMGIARSNSEPDRDVAAQVYPFLPNYGLPVRGSSHVTICRYGSRLNGIRPIAFLAKASSCSLVCRLAFGQDIHAQMLFRRVQCPGLSRSPGSNDARG